MNFRATFIRFSLLVSVFMTSAATLLLIGAGKAGAESPEQAGAGISLAHLEVSGVIIRVHPSMFFIRPTHGLQPRTISMLKAERIGLHEARIGDPVTLLVDEGNLLVDAFKAGAPSLTTASWLVSSITPIKPGKRSSCQLQRESSASKWTLWPAVNSLC